MESSLTGGRDSHQAHQHRHLRAPKVPTTSGLLAGRRATVYPGTLEKPNLSDTSLVKILLGNDNRSDAENTPQHL